MKKKIKTAIQRKSKKKYPQPSGVQGQFQSRPFAPQTSIAREEIPNLQAQLDEKKRGGYNFANISILPSEEAEIERSPAELSAPPGFEGIQRQELEEGEERVQMQPLSKTLETETLADEEEELTLNRMLESDRVQLQPELAEAIANAPQQTIQRRGKDRHAQVDDRHNISDPYIDPDRWLETLKRERVADLFRTPQGLDGHVEQIQGEINRLISDRNRKQKLEGQSGDSVTAYTNALNALRNASIESAKAAQFDFEKFGIKFHPLASDLYLERSNGKLKVDGKAL